LALTVTIGLIIASCSGAQQKQRSDESSITENVVTDFQLTTIEGKTFRLADHLGKKVILLDFWATWCAPCKVEMPFLERLYKNHKDKGLMVMAISMDDPTDEADVNAFIRSRGFTFLVAIDKDTTVVNIYNPKRTAPFSLIIGLDGKVRKSYEGFQMGDQSMIELEILSLLSENQPTQ
jgi:peroxiredoxin